MKERMIYAHVPGAEEEPVVRNHEDIADPVEVEKKRREHAAELSIRREMEMQALGNDPIHHPSHYTHGDIECIDAIRAALTEEEFRGFLRANALKYLWRLGLKGDAAEDVGKAVWYLERLREELRV